MKLILLRNNPNYLKEAATWFHHIWQVPMEAYQESMIICIENKTSIPQWYLIINNHNQIIAGAGVIDNDFHERLDLTPNLCALYVEAKYRKQGIAKYLLNTIREDLASLGYNEVYLITDHTQFYEKCDWQFYTMVKENSGTITRMYRVETIKKAKD